MKIRLQTGAALLVIPSIVAGQVTWVDFTVTRHINTATFAAANVDAALNDVNERLRLDNHDCVDDVPCSVRFRRDGAVNTFGTAADGLDVITTQAELDEVLNIPTHRVKVVDVVNFCAGGINPAIIGCGTCNGFGYVVEDWVGGNTYVHEFGHNVMGCGHRNSCTNNIMHQASIVTNNSVNAAECASFGGSAYTQLCGDFHDQSGGPLTVSGGPYWITCDVVVPADKSLTIEAGVEIQFDQGRRIKSYGWTRFESTTFLGTDDPPIEIYSNNDGRNFPSATIDGANSELILKDGGEMRLR